jgi:hypothetical protein
MSSKQIDEALDLILEAQKGLVDNNTIEISQKLYEASLVLIKLRSAQLLQEELNKLTLD